MNTTETSLTFVQTAEGITNLNNWIFETIQPYIKGRMLELGSGLGRFSSIFMKHNLPLHLSDEKESNREFLQIKFDGSPMFKMVHNIDFHCDTFSQTYASMLGVFDTVIAVNITEHGFYNDTILKNAKDLLRRRGHFVALTPSRAVLFNRMEKDLSGLKEYNLTVARNLMGIDFQILKVRCFNWVAESESSDFSQFGLSTLAIFRKTI